MLLVNGFIRGIWRHKFQGNRLEVILVPFGTVPTWARRAAEEEAERLAIFLDRKLNLVWRDERHQVWPVKGKRFGAG